MGIAEDLFVNGKQYSGIDEMIVGFREHFSNLANPVDDSRYKEDYHKTVLLETKQIKQLVQDKDVEPVTLEELKNAMGNINRRKAPDYYGLTIESLLNGGQELHVAILNLLNSILQIGKVPQTLKMGLITPVFKNKGQQNEAGNYRGITVLPVLEKVLEMIIKDRITDMVDSTQSKYQRGFTAKTSPLNAALIVEEITRDCKDTGQSCDLIFLDAKAAFDVVDHKHLMRRVYQAGIQNKHWSIIEDLHHEAQSVVKLGNKKSDPFQIHLGVRQGGVLSTDCYKLYINPLLKTLEYENLGCRIGNILCNASACADDVTLNSKHSTDTQILINIAEQFSNSERYMLQPKKTEALKVCPKDKVPVIQEVFNIYENEITNAQTVTHLGIKRSTSVRATAEENVDHNIQKARRTAYSLLPAGLHASSGLDLQTALHLIKVYVSPVLLYGLEVILPNQKLLQKLELFQKRILKQTCQLPCNASDAGLYILTGFLPVEAQIHKKALTLFYNICKQKEDSLEKQLAKRQLMIKDSKSISWFICIRKLFWLYDLGSPNDLLNCADEPRNWKLHMQSKVNLEWADRLLGQAQHLSSLKHINLLQVDIAHPHLLLTMPITSAYDANRLLVKMNFMMGTYILQSTRAAFNQNAIDDTCRLCNETSETMPHFMITCSILAVVRDPIINELQLEYETITSESWAVLSSHQKTSVIIDCTNVLGSDKVNSIRKRQLNKLEFQCRRLIFALHTERYRHLLLLEKVKNKAASCKANITQQICTKARRATKGSGHIT